MASELRIFLLVLTCALAALPALALLWFPSAWSRGPWAMALKVAATVLLLVWVGLVAASARARLLRQFRTLSNLLESLSREDYSMKGARAREPGELGELYRQINNLTDNLKHSRQSERELLSILEKVVSQINVAIIVFDAHDRIRLVNELASSLLKSTREELIGMRCEDTVLAGIEAAPEPRLVDFRFPRAFGRWQVRQHTYRQQGVSSRILFIADLKQVLSEEETSAWQRLIRVISHEINNSLTPIISLCQTLAGMVMQPDAQHDTDVREGLNVIGERARGLQEFISTYARLARVPMPNKSPFPVMELATRLRHFFAGQPLLIEAFPEVSLFGDVVQLEQALINLIKNGLQANPPTQPPVQLICYLSDDQCVFQICDRGAGIRNPENLFVPFYTTKAEGAGIGLALCRRIATLHHGHVTLENREDGPGAVARLLLPLPPREAGIH